MVEGISGKIKEHINTDFITNRSGYNGFSSMSLVIGERESWIRKSVGFHPNMKQLERYTQLIQHLTACSKSLVLMQTGRVLLTSIKHHW